ncbi:MAG: hypothetical protein ACFB0D_11140 [Phormidesmis sp.]
MIPTVENAPTGCNRGKNRLSVEIEKSEILKKRSYLRNQNPFNYRICISWFGGVQIHPKF